MRLPTDHRDRIERRLNMYVATVNVPGYLPMDDEPPTFESAAEAWAYLADERRRGEEAVYEYGDSEEFTETVAELDARAAVSESDASVHLGAVYGSTPGYDGEHDLGLAYCVSLTEDDDDDELPDTCLNTVDGHWYVITYGRAPYQIHAKDCATCGL